MKTILLIISLLATILGVLMLLSCPPPNEVEWNFETNVIGLLIAVGGYHEASKIIKELDNE